MKRVLSTPTASRDDGENFQTQSFLTLVDTPPTRAAAAYDGTAGNDRLTGTAGDDTFNMASGGTDRVSGLDGYDYFFFGAALDATDRINGGLGTADEVGIQGTYSDFTVTSSMFTGVEALFLISGGSYDITLAADLVSADSFFNVYGGTGTAAITTNVDGSAVAGTLLFFSSAGNDTYLGGGGNDFFRYRAGGNDVYDGGGGVNRISVFGASDGIVFDLGFRGAQTVGNGTVTLRNVQDVSGTSGADTLTGTNAANWILGNGGNDTLIGLAGDDLITVGPFAAPAGPVFATNGVVDGGRGTDIVDFFANGGNTAGATVSLQVTGAQDTGQGIYQLDNVEGISGTLFADTLTGDSKGNSLFGSDGTDTLVGAAGNDFLYGDAAYGLDSAFGATGPQTIIPNLEAAFADTLDGGRGRDVLDGGGGDDILIGGADADTLTGGAGADLFTFRAIDDSTVRNTDTIVDFTTGDRIDVSAIDADPATRGNQAFHFGATPGHVGDITFAYDATTNLTTVSLFVDGDNRADATISMVGNIALTEADFIL